MGYHSLTRRQQRRRDIWEFQKKCLRDWKDRENYYPYRFLGSYHYIGSKAKIDPRYIEKVPAEEVFLLGYEAAFVPKPHMRYKWYYEDLCRILEMCSPKTRYDEYKRMRIPSYARNKSKLRKKEWSPTPIDPDHNDEWVAMTEKNPLIKKWFNYELFDEGFRKYWGYVFNRMGWVNKIKIPIYREYIYYYTDLTKEGYSKSARYNNEFETGNRKQLAVRKIQNWKDDRRYDNDKIPYIERAKESYQSMIEEIEDEQE